MTTYNRTVGNQASTPLSAPSLTNGRVPCVIDSIIDFSVTGNTNLSADIFNTLYIPPGYAILASGAEVFKADTAGNSGTIQLKLGATNQGSAVAPSATGYLATVGTFTPVVPSGTAVFLNTVIGTGAINAIIRVYAILLDTRQGFGGVATGTLTTPAGATNTQFVDQSTYTTLTIVT